MSQTTEKYDLYFIITQGTENPSRAVLGLAMALAAVSSEMRVGFFFTLRGVEWLDPNVGNYRPEPQFDGTEDYMQALLDLGVTIEGCSVCVMRYLSHLKDEDGNHRLREGVTISGLSAASVNAAAAHTLVF